VRGNDVGAGAAHLAGFLILLRQILGERGLDRGVLGVRRSRIRNLAEWGRPEYESRDEQDDARHQPTDERPNHIVLPVFGGRLNDKALET
jgi:hypothetical protein